jgi:hypothetical protein
LANNGTQQALANFSVVRNCEAAMRRILMSQNNMAGAALSIKLVTDLLQSFHHLTA